MKVFSFEFLKFRILEILNFHRCNAGNALMNQLTSCAYISLQRIETNWRTGRHTLQRIHCRSETSKGVYCLQYDDTRIVSGLRDNTIKVSKKYYIHIN